MTAPLIILLLVTVTYALLGVSIWRSQPSGPANRAFACLALTLGAWTLSNGLVATHAGTPWGIVWARAAFFSASLLPLWCFHFVAVFPRPTLAVSRRLRSVMTVCAIASSAASLTPLIAQTTSSLNQALHVTYGPLYPLFGAYLVISLTGNLVLLSRKLRLLTGVERLQVQFVLVGCVIATAGGSITNLLVPLVFRTSRLNVYGPIFGLVMVAFIAHAIVRYRLLNIRLVVRGGVTEVGASIIAGVAFLGVAGLVSWMLALQLQALPIGVTLVLALLLAQAFQPLRRAVRAGLDRYFFRTRYDYPVALREISRAMSDITELRRLFEYTCRAICDTLRAERVVLYVKDAGGSDYRLESSWGAEEPRLPSTIRESSPLVQSLSNGQQRVLIAADFRRQDDGVSSVESDDVHRLGIECMLPVLVHGQVGGFYAIGSKRSGDPYFTEDVDLISAVGSQVGIAIKLHVQIGLAEAERRRAERLVSFGALARGLAHEIKNPLVAIRTFAELLPERADDEEFRDSFAKIVVQEIVRIDDLVDRLRGFPGSPAPRFQQVDLAYLLRETLALLRGQIERARIRITMAIRPRTPPIFGDPAQLTQLLLNVLMNALQAVDDGGQITIRLSLVDGRRVLLEIADTGPGVPVELLPKIFEPFVTTKAEGSGLGLAICREIAEAHHSVIRAENNSPGRGLNVVLEFPALDTTRRDPAADRNQSLVGM